MSTKVYDAYRLAKGIDLWGYLRILQPKVLDRTVDRYLEYFEVGRAELAAKNPGLGEKELDSKTILELDKACREAGETNQHHPFDFDVSMAIHEHEGRFYFRAFEGMASRGCLTGFLDEDSRVEDFHYQDQSDRPEEISRQAWAHRRGVWEAIAENWESRVVLGIVKEAKVDRLAVPMLEKYRAKTKKRR